MSEDERELRIKIAQEIKETFGSLGPYLLVQKLVLRNVTGQGS